MKKIFLIKFSFIIILTGLGVLCLAKENAIIDLDKNKICVQVITPAKNPVTGECKEFPSPCDVPSGWIKVNSCSGSIITIEPEENVAKPIICKEYFWYDETNLKCQGPKTFCGYFMRKGLYVFETEEDCEKSLTENPRLKENKIEEIKKEIKEKNEISLEDISKILNRINFEPGRVEIDGEKISFEKEKIIIKKVGEREIKILVNPEKIILKEGEKMGEVEGNLSIEKEKLLFEGREIKISPEELFEKLKIQDPLNLEMKLKLGDEKALWLIKFTQERKILGIFPIKIQKEIEISAQKEEIEKLKENKKPWWSFYF